MAAAAIVALAVYAREASVSLDRSEFLTGYILFGLMLALALFNARKKLSMVPLGRAAYWLAGHAVGGMLAIALFFIHTNSFWPEGGYEQALAVIFYLVSLSGIFGFLIQRYFPKRLVQSDFEIIYERIPAEVAEVREKAEAAVRACTDATGSDTLARHYFEALSWYFRRPRFFLNHALGGEAGEHWIRHQHQTVDRYLSDAEREHLESLSELARYKNQIDLHYACQSIMKLWLLVHVPLAAAVLGLMFWHVIVVNVYAL
jgi:hypothetical protein